MNKKLYLYKNITFKRILSQITIAVTIVLCINSGYLHSQESPDNEGIALSINVPGHSKGLVLPKVKLTNLNQYKPVQGIEREGLLVENTYTDESQDIYPGIYIWNLNMWDKLLNFSDIPRIARGTKVYTGDENPNLSTGEIKNAPIGSLYINKLTNLVYKKGLTIWKPEVYIGSIKYNGSSSIVIREDTVGNTLEAIVGSGLKITANGISAIVDSSNMSINKNLISAKNEESLWNANKLQGTAIDITTPIDGNILQYKGNKWLNTPDHIYKGEDGILIDNNTVRLLIDTTLNILENNHIGAKNDDPLWNVNKLQGIPLDITDPVKDQLLKYDGNKWLNADRAVYTNGAGVSELTGLTVNLDIDHGTLDVAYTKGSQQEDGRDTPAYNTRRQIAIKAKSDAAIWNANKLQGRKLQINDNLKEGDILRYSGSEWLGFQQPSYTGRNGIMFTDTTQIDTTITIRADRRMIDFSNNFIRAKNENGIWNANKLRDILIDTREQPTQDQLLTYDSAQRMWVPRSVKEPPAGRAVGETLFWDNSVWRVPNKEDTVTITGPEIYFPESPVSIFIGNSHLKYLMIDKDGKVQVWNNMAWHLHGNGDANSVEPSKDVTLGFIDDSKSNLVFKTNNTERIRINSLGNLYFNSNDIHFSGLDNPTNQSKQDSYIMMSFNDTQGPTIKKWSGTLWSMQGNKAIAGDVDYILGFNKDVSETNLAFKLSGKDRIKLASDGSTIITDINNQVFIKELKNPVTEQEGRKILAIDSQNKLWALNNQVLDSLTIGTSTIGYTDPLSPSALVFKTRDKDRMRIEPDGSIKMELNRSGEKNYDIILLDKNSGSLSKTDLRTLLQTTITGTEKLPDSQTQVISLGSISSDPEHQSSMAIDISDTYGNKSIHIVYADSKPETATIRNGISALNIGYDITGNLPAILTYAYDVTRNNRNVLASDNSTETIKVDAIEISFKLEKINNTYKLMPKINRGDKTVGYLILQSN